MGKIFNLPGVQLSINFKVSHCSHRFIESRVYENAAHTQTQHVHTVCFFHLTASLAGDFSGSLGVFFFRGSSTQKDSRQPSQHPPADQRSGEEGEQ